MRGLATISISIASAFARRITLYRAWADLPALTMHRKLEDLHFRTNERFRCWRRIATFCSG